MANYVLLERIELNASAASVTFNNIPQSGYTDLKVVYSTRAISGTDVSMGVQINGATTGLSNRILEGNGASAASAVSSVPLYAGSTDGSGNTANVFANGEMYIPNYNSTSTYKSISIENVDENNGTTAYADLVAGLWSNTAAITSVGLYVYGGGSFAQYSTFSLYGLAAVGTTPVIAPKATGGNLVTTDGTYWYHAFTSSGTFTPLASLSCDYLVVAGGAGGSYDAGGGGGAGGLRSTVTATGGGGSLESALSLTAQAYAVTIGAGGTGALTGSRTGANGSDSTLSTITSTGGGGGGYNGASGATGGSGGGGSRSGGNGGARTVGQGYAGGNGTGGTTGGGGGGGAGSAGTSASTGGGAGGNGVQLTAFASATGTGVSSYYAGGGGGGGNTTPAAAGGSGGGGQGGTPGGLNITPGTANTGGGGGGCGGGDSTGTANGGSGIVIVRYAV